MEYKPKIDLQTTTKEIRSVLNKVTEGNMQIIFNQLLEIIDKYF